MTSMAFAIPTPFALYTLFSIVQILSFSFSVILLIGIAIPAYAATDIDAIQPSGTTIVVGITGEDVPIHGTLHEYNAGTAFVVIAPSITLPAEFQEIIYGDKEENT